MSSIDEIKNKYFTVLQYVSENKCVLEVPKNVFLGFRRFAINYTSGDNTMTVSDGLNSRTVDCPNEYHNVLLRAMIANMLELRKIDNRLLKVVNEDGFILESVDWRITEESAELADRIKSSGQEDRQKIFESYDFLREII